MECCLERGELVRLDGEKNGVVLRCTGGTIWLTCGDGRDYLLTPGSSFAIAAGLVVVAEALQKAECTLGRSFSASNSQLKTVVRLAAC